MISLKKYEKMYDNFDDGHDREHLKRVRSMAIALAKKYDSSNISLAYIAATLHDIGLSKDRKNHEIVGAKMILTDPYLKKHLTSFEIKQIAHAVAEHRSSSGRPVTSLDKIISDADRSASTTSYSLYRAIMYGIKHEEGDLKFQINRAIDHLTFKYGVNGKGRRCYYPETKKRLNQIFNPIISIKHKPDRIQLAWNMIEKKYQRKIKKALKTDNF
jgi:HD superfamily phosphodiesterase